MPKSVDGDNCFNRSPGLSIKAGIMPDSRVIVGFKIAPDGKVTDIEVLSFEGSPVFPVLCTAAVKRAAPFDPIPIELPSFLKGDYLQIRFTFLYN